MAVGKLLGFGVRVRLKFTVWLAIVKLFIPVWYPWLDTCTMYGPGARQGKSARPCGLVDWLNLGWPGGWLRKVALALEIGFCPLLIWRMRLPENTVMARVSVPLAFEMELSRTVRVAKKDPFPA
jgi:hypothetical protein